MIQNAQDAPKINEISKYQSFFDVYSRFTANTDDIQGHVSGSILENTLVWSIFKHMID